MPKSKAYTVKELQRLYNIRYNRSNVNPVGSVISYKEVAEIINDNDHEMSLVCIASLEIGYELGYRTAVENQRKLGKVMPEFTEDLQALDVVRIEEAAALLHVKKTTVYNYIKTGQLPATRKGKFYYVCVNDIQEFLKNK